MTPSTLVERIEAVRKRVDSAARSVGRDPGAVQIIAVSKTFPADRVLEASQCGLQVFGENRIQEAEAKISAVREAAPGLEWHLVGSLQRNKAARAAELFSVIHSLDRTSLADALARAAAKLDRRIRVLLQVNIDREEQKGGALPENVPGLLAHVDTLDGLDPLGFMAIPRLVPGPEGVRPAFARMRELRDSLNGDRPPSRQLRILSMGMSSDFELAIREGADWIRIGSAIFGERSRE
ncbi:MAG: YggS family pyridoxal phosphate-dependent enzyme [Myxococcota bacterium]